MRPSTLLVGALSLVSPALGFIIRPSVTDYQVLEHFDKVPQGWIKSAPVSPNQLLRLRLAVKQEKTAQFEQMVLDLSTPGHPRYGQHMKREEINEFLRPSSDVSDAIRSWLSDEGVPESAIEDDGDWINFIVTARQAEHMLQTRFYNFRNKVNGVRRIRTLEYSVPSNIAPYVQMIQPTTRFGQINPQRSHAFVDRNRKIDTTVDPDCNTTVTPKCLRELYDIGNFSGKPSEKNLLGISGYLDQYARYSDFDKFINTYAPEQTNANFSVVSIHDGVNLQNSSLDSVEASLDVQYAITLAYATNATFYTAAGRGPLVPDLDQPDPADGQNEPYLDQLQYFAALPDEELPTVLSTSYGEDEQSVPASYSESVCTEFAKLGARGVSVIFSSGDTGVGSACQTNDGKNTTRFLPIFPAACPFVTSVGGTKNINPERAVYFSSGGFSDRFQRPSYQDKAVAAYLEKLGNQWDGLYNPSGRGFPDVAAQGVGFAVVDHGRTLPVGGTSASAPTFAGVIASLNAVRLEAGKPVLGFLNPWLYAGGASGFTDITDGGSTGCTGRDIYSGLPTPYVPYASWNATAGWDPVTGLGTPIFSALSKLALE